MLRDTGGKMPRTSIAAPYLVRPVTPADGDLLGSLLHEAYDGTIDHHGETVDDFKQEMFETLMGRYGEMLWTASFIALNEDGAAVSTSLITDNQQFGPLLAFAATIPAHQKKGLAGELIVRSLKALRDLSISVLTLVVTPGNDSAVSLYKKLGFESQQQD